MHFQCKILQILQHCFLINLAVSSQKMFQVLMSHILLEKKLLSLTLKGSSAVPIGEPFEEPFLVAGRTRLDPCRNLSTEGST